MKTIKEAREIVLNFNYSTLEFYKGGSNPVFIDLRTGDIDTWAPDTDVNAAETQNPVKYIGNLTAKEAKNGIKPYSSFAGINEFGLV